MSTPPPEWVTPEQPAAGPQGWGPAPSASPWGPAPTGPAAGGPGAPGGRPGQTGQGWSTLGAGERPAHGSVLTRRGIVALKPLGFADFFDGAFRAIRHNPRVMIGLTALVLGVTNLLVALPATAALGSVGFGTDPDAEPTTAQLTGLFGGLLALVPATFLQSVAVVVLTGMLILSVTQSVVDRRTSLGELWARARGRVWPLIGWSVLQAVGLALLTAVALGPAVALFVVEELVGGAAALLVLGLLGLAVGTWLYVVLAFVPVLIVVERLGVVAAVRRSYALVRGAFWKVLGILLLTGLLTSIVSQTLATPFSLVGGVGLVALESRPVLAGIVYGASIVLGSTVGLVLAVPFLAAVVALLYVDRRIRLEGLDVALARVLQDEQA
ncbi:hypothetical protein [Aquipuribacter sp. SD81]|uniref:hypothetical protein n=1 Tax=Aquipuribacter sp. SD81 TaxID=3127703 RepID=UPI003017A9F9